jgi:hypothetical protein
VADGLVRQTAEDGSESENRANTRPVTLSRIVTVSAFAELKMHSAHGGRATVLLKTTSSGQPSSVQKTNSRRLKVETTGDFFYRKTKPAIRLKGKWLADAGFAPDSYVA